MTAMQQAQKFFDAWNAHDTDATLATFAEGGSYSDPNMSDGISGPQLAVYASAIFATFSDLQFEIVKEFECGDGAIVGEWLMKGTHDGDFMSLPPPGHSIAVPGIDVIDNQVGAVRLD